jgi:hypothetical protein
LNLKKTQKKTQMNSHPAHGYRKSTVVQLVLMSGGGGEVESTDRNINPAQHVPNRAGQHFDPAGRQT